MNQKQFILRGALVLTTAGILSRVAGFFYRIFLSNVIGAEGMGIYQLIFPIFSLALALSSGGVQTAVTNLVSGAAARAEFKKAKGYFFAAFLLSVSLSLLLLFLLFVGSPFLCRHFLKEERCIVLLRYLSFSLPFSTLHALLNGYFIGMKQTTLPAFSQLLEQAIRVGSAYLLYQIMTEKAIPISPILAVLATVIAEIVTVLYLVTRLLFHFSKLKTVPVIKRKTFHSLLSLSSPLAANRISLNLLQSLEALSVPMMLQIFGYSKSHALSLYGILNGMALPLVLFPSAITGSVSTVLLPAVSEASSLHDQKRIRRAVEKTIQGSLLLGIFFTGVFLFFGKSLGTLLFSNSEAGEFIVILAWICPFLYLGGTLSSILNGLGKTMTTFLQNLAGIFLRLLFLWILVPKYGITAYLWGTLASQMAVSFSSLWQLKRTVSFSFAFSDWIFKPGAALTAAACSLFLLRRLWAEAALPNLMLLILQGFFFTLVFLLALSKSGLKEK